MWRFAVYWLFLDDAHHPDSNEQAERSRRDREE
jgi:hypothetical protein